ncbi:MAG: glycosyltransferase family 2 protein [Armatimonadetes bacterium]|nr:glycosyltransferase family 2 protein [Armatimonadota bacterium]
MWHGQTVSVVFPTYNEKNSIAQAIREVLETGYIDEVVVVNNNAAPGTSEEVARTPAREIFEPTQGYGYACRRGLTEARGELIVLSEPDGTFAGRDILKLLAYSDDFDAVFGSRTNTILIWEGANMGFLLKWGNWAVAKLLEILFNTTTLTDVGCTMKLFRRSVVESLKKRWTVGDSRFSPELMMHVILSRSRFIEIPVNYRRRVGLSSVTGRIGPAALLGLGMVGLICGVWLRYRLSQLLSLPRSLALTGRK